MQWQRVVTRGVRHRLLLLTCENLERTTGSVTPLRRAHTRPVGQCVAE
jgi:hypothetical protein